MRSSTIALLVLVVLAFFAASAAADVTQLTVGGQLELPNDCCCNCATSQRSWLAAKIAELVPQALMQKFVSNDLI